MVLMAEHSPSFLIGLDPSGLRLELFAHTLVSAHATSWQLRHLQDSHRLALRAYS